MNSITKRNPLIRLALLLSGIGLSSCGGSLPSESDARQWFENHYHDEFTKGVFYIRSFKKTDGQQSEAFGVKLYSLEYVAEIEYLRDYDSVLSVGGLGQMFGTTVGRGRRGEKKTLRGSVTFEKTEKGWRPSGGGVGTTVSQTAQAESHGQDTRAEEAERQRALARLEQQRREEEENRRRQEEEQKRAAEAEERRRRERNARFAVSDLKCQVYEGNETAAFTYIVKGGVPPYQLQAYLNNVPLETVLKRYTCKAGLNSDPSPMYSYSSRDIYDPGDGESTASFKITAKSGSFFWPPDLPFPLKIKVEVWSSGGAVGPKSAELAIDSGPHKFIVPVEDGFHPQYLEIDGKSEKPAGNVTGTWQLTRQGTTLMGTKLSFSCDVTLTTHEGELHGHFVDDGQNVELAGTVAGSYVILSKVGANALAPLNFFGMADAKLSEIHGGWAANSPYITGSWDMVRVGSPVTQTKETASLTLDTFIKGGRLGAFGHGTRCTGYYNSKNEVVDIQPEGTDSPKAHESAKALVHAGVDIVAQAGVGIRAIADGTVADIIDKESDTHFPWLGFMVLIKHAQPVHERDTWSLYLHLNGKPQVKVGDAVKRGETIIGHVGSTGMAMGPHLHLEVRHFRGRFSPKWKNIYGKLSPAKERNFDEDDFKQNWEDPVDWLVADLAGRWSGEYENPPGVNPKHVSFAAVLNRDNTGFAGTITEPNAQPGKEPISAAILEGKIDSNNDVRFHKKYQIPGQDGPTIEYQGHLSNDGKTIQGRWRYGSESRAFSMKRE